jgi:hypothetical protein
MLAVLEDAIHCFQNNHGARRRKGKRLFDEAQEWIFGAQGDWTLGFETVCGALALDPEYIREGLARWRKEQVFKDRGAPLWNGSKPPSLMNGIQSCAYRRAAIRRLKK